MNINIADTTAIILAGGKNSRINSPLPKCLLPMGDKKIIDFTLDTLNLLSLNRIYIVTRQDDDSIERYLSKSPYIFIKQNKPLGNAHALKRALGQGHIISKYLIVLMSDSTAFFKPLEIKKFIDASIKANAHAGITLFPFQKENLTIGTIYLHNSNKFLSVKLRQENNTRHNGIPYIQGGYWFFNTAWIKKNISLIKKSPLNGEYNLTDMLKIAKDKKSNITPYIINDLPQWSSINTCDEYQETLKKYRNGCKTISSRPAILRD